MCVQPLIVCLPSPLLRGYNHFSKQRHFRCADHYQKLNVDLTVDRSIKNAA